MFEGAICPFLFLPKPEIVPLHEQVLAKYAGVYEGGQDFFLKPGTRLEFVIKDGRASIFIGSWEVAGNRYLFRWRMPLSLIKHSGAPSISRLISRAISKIVYESLGKRYYIKKIK